NSHVIYAMFTPGKKHECLPAFVKRENEILSAEVVVDKEGIVRIKSEKPIEMIRFLLGRGYGNVSSPDATNVEMPLIDPTMPEDVARYIAPVDEYYDAIKSRAKECYSIGDGVMKQLLQGIEEERMNAKKGIVEYYMGEQQILDALKNTGFTNIEIKHHETEPFYNITAIKG
ncbi:MAG: hypothetical protein QXT19_03470, partial [Candidatus Woesearchaeota archaeon]